MTSRLNDSREGATINVVANYFHAELSDPAATAREELLSAVRLHQESQQKSLPKGFGEFFIRDDGAGNRMREVNETAKAAPAARPREFDIIRL